MFKSLSRRSYSYEKNENKSKTQLSFIYKDNRAPISCTRVINLFSRHHTIISNCYLTPIKELESHIYKEKKKRKYVIRN